MAGFGLNNNELAELEKMMGGGNAPSNAVSSEAPAQADTLMEALQEREEAALTAVDTAPTQLEQAPAREAPPAAEFNDNPGAPIRPVPYKRFAEVNSERSSLKAERDELRAQLDSLRSLQNEAPRGRQQEPAKREARSWLESVLDEETEPQNPAPSSDEIPSWAKPVMSTLEQIQQERSMQALDRVVADMRTSYPDLPEEIILAGIAQGSSAEDIVQAWDHVGRAYVKAHGYTPAQAAAAQAAQGRPANADVAPRLTSSKGQMNAPEPPSWAKGWGKEHQNAVAAFIKTQG